MFQAPASFSASEVRCVLVVAPACCLRFTAVPALFGVLKCWNCRQTRPVQSPRSTVSKHNSTGIQCHLVRTPPVFEISLGCTWTLVVITSNVASCTSLVCVRVHLPHSPAKSAPSLWRLAVSTLPSFPLCLPVRFSRPCLAACHWTKVHVTNFIKNCYGVRYSSFASHSFSGRDICPPKTPSVLEKRMKLQDRTRKPSCLRKKTI